MASVGCNNRFVLSMCRTTHSEPNSSVMYFTHAANFDDTHIGYFVFVEPRGILHPYHTVMRQLDLKASGFTAIPIGKTTTADKELKNET